MTINQEYSEKFVLAFSNIQYHVNRTAHEKGWWNRPREDGTVIALMHSELSEALEGLRHGNPPDEHVGGYSSVEIELADVIIRIMDFAEERNFDVAGALLAKATFNDTREHKHGGKNF